MHIIADAFNQSLIDVRMCIDHTGHNCAGRCVDDLVSLHLGTIADFDDPALIHRNVSLNNFPFLVDRDYGAIFNN